jgi:acyl-coenzyme A synthetase/AMP-(fatty) acid ligase
VTPARLLERELDRDRARPFLTWYDDAATARVELSVATAANWAAKVAGWLVEEHDIEPGDAVGLAGAAHWCTAVIALGAWTAGAAVALRSERPLLELDLDPMGAALAGVVGAQPDRFVPVAPVRETAPALLASGRRWSHGELAADADRAVRDHGLDAGCRLLSVLDFSTPTGLDVGLLVPLAAGGSVVLVVNPDADRLAERCTTEQVTHTAGVGVGGVERLV